MALGKTALLLSLSLVGFLAGSTLYFILNWIATSVTFGVIYIPIPISAPWLMSGIAGSVLSVLALQLATHFSTDQ